MFKLKKNKLVFSLNVGHTVKRNSHTFLQSDVKQQLKTVHNFSKIEFKVIYTHIDCNYINIIMSINKIYIISRN